jgi:hypothetical protein
MKMIWKFPLVEMASQEVKMPEGAQILAVQGQAGQGCLWALVDPFAPKVPRMFHVVATGERLPDAVDKMQHCGTYQLYQLHGGALVFHVFEEVRIST